MERVVGKGAPAQELRLVLRRKGWDSGTGEEWGWD